MSGKSRKGAGVCEHETSQGKAPGSVTKTGRLTYSLQEAEQAAYANTQVPTGQPAVNAPAQDVQLATGTTSVTDGGAMDVDEGATTHETVGEGHGGVKRKAGEDAESASKKLRMGKSITLFHVLAADITIVCRTCHWSLEEVVHIIASFILQHLKDNCRDRENCTVFVSDLPASGTEDDLKTLFKDVSLFAHFFLET